MQECDTCLYRDYLPDHPPCDTCSIIREETGIFPLYRPENNDDLALDNPRAAW